MKKESLFMLLLLVFSYLYVNAQPRERNTGIQLKPVTKTFALTGLQIITKPGEKIDKGTIIIKDGLIEAVGTNLSVPADAKVIKADSMFVYAGFIDGLSFTGVPEPKRDNNRPRITDPGNPTYEQSGIMPDRSATEMLVASDKSVGNMRKLGFTTVHVVPRGKMLPGKGAIMNLHGTSATDMVIATPTSMFSQLVGSGARAYPSTVIAVMSKYRDLYKQATQSLNHQEMYDKDPSGMSRPEHDKMLEAFYPLIKGEMYNFFHAPDIKSIHRVMALQKDLSFQLALVNVKEGWHVLDQLKANPKHLVFLSLDLPKEVKKSEKKEGEEPTEEEKAFEAKRAKFMEQLVSQAAAFEKEDINFGFSAATVGSGDIRKNLRRMIAAGLSEDRALEALTTTPASLLGLSKMMGTIEKGKIANLLVTDKPYFEEKSNVRYVFVDGNLYEYEAPKKKVAKKSADGAPAAEGGLTGAVLAGKWSFTVDVPGQTTSGTLTVNEDLSAVIETEQSGSQNIDEITIEGDDIFFSMPINIQGQQLVLEYELTVDGDSFSGIVAVGDFGEFDVKGERVP